MKLNIDNIMKAITVIDNQILTLDNHIETNKEQSSNLKNKQKELRNLKTKVIDKLEVKYKVLDSDLSLKDAKRILDKYINPIGNKTIKNNKFKDDKSECNIKETKLVELSRLRVYRRIHMNCCLNPNKTEAKRAELLKYMNENDGAYPKAEAILVRKDKDPEDRRRVIYNIEDGYRRYTLAGELEMDKVYVNIIAE